MSDHAQDGNSVTATEVFNKGCAETRLLKIASMLIQNYVREDIKNYARECRLRGDPVSMYPLTEVQIIEKFGDRAKTEALKILEQERKNIADFHSPALKRYLETYIKQLRYVLMDDGKPFKVFQEESWNPDYTGKSFRKVITPYTRHEIIHRFTHLLEGFVDFRPYLSQELSSLWNEADALASQEGLIEIEEKASKTQKTEPEEAKSGE
jgi:hypothetical protein